MITAIHYHGGKLKYDMGINAAQALDYLETPAHVWLDIVKEEGTEIEKILKVLFPEHYMLLMKDCLEDSMPKLEFFENFVFMVFKTFPTKEFKYSQLNVILGKDIIITIRQGKTNLAHLQESIIKQGKISVDFVLYRMLDTIFEHYYNMMDSLENETEKCEAICVDRPDVKNLRSILQLKRNLISLHRILAHEREILSILIKSNIKQIKPKTTLFFRDVYDDILHLIDTEETIRDVLSGSIEIHLSSVNNSINEIVKILTIISAFVMVPTMIAGVYGMNFKFMPELGSIFGYPFALSLMGVSVFGMYLFFRRKGWM